MASRRVPKNAVDVDLQQADRRVRPGGRREVLVVGEFGKGIRSELAGRGAALTLVDRIYDAFMLLADRDFVVVVNPQVESCGLDFVNAVVVLPADDGWEYAVIVVPPHASFVKDAREVPLVTTILSVNPAKLLGTAEPMA